MLFCHRMKLLISHHYLRYKFLLSVCNWIHTIWRLIIDVASIDIGEVWRWSTILIVLGIRGIYSVLRLLWRGRLLHTLIYLREF